MYCWRVKLLLKIVSALQQRTESIFIYVKCCTCPRRTAPMFNETSDNYLNHTCFVTSCRKKFKVLSLKKLSRYKRNVSQNSQVSKAIGHDFNRRNQFYKTMIDFKKGTQHFFLNISFTDDYTF